MYHLKKIAAFSLWLACLVILAHLFIAHDHHPDDSVFGCGDVCHSDKPDSPAKHNHGFPLHCHAFNDLSFDKSKSSVVVASNFPATDFLPVEIANPIASGLIITNHRFSFFHESPDYAVFLKFSHLRAPPSLV